MRAQTHPSSSYLFDRFDFGLKYYIILYHILSITVTRGTFCFECGPLTLWYFEPVLLYFLFRLGLLAFVPAPLELVYLGCCRDHSHFSFPKSFNWQKLVIRPSSTTTLGIMVWGSTSYTNFLCKLKMIPFYDGVPVEEGVPCNSLVWLKLFEILEERFCC